MLRTATRRKRALTTLVGVSSLALLTAGPAAAQTATVGSGAGTGWEYVPETGKECGLPPSGVGFTSDEFVLTHASIYESGDTSGPDVASFDGQATMTIITGPVTQAPQGAAKGICPNGDQALVPSQVPLTSVAIDGTDLLGNTIHCDGLTSGTYTRVNSTVAFEFVVSCDISSLTGSVQDVPVRHVVEGEQVACFPLPCPPNPANPDTRGDASSFLTTAFEAEGPV